MGLIKRKVLSRNRDITSHLMDDIEILASR